MSNLDMTTSAGLEVIQRAAARLLKTGIDAQIDAINTEYVAIDTEFYSFMDLDVDLPIAVEHIVKIHTGHKPSLIEAPYTEFPNISCMAWLATPRVADDDHADMYYDTLRVEIIVKAMGGPWEERWARENQQAEELVNVRAQRTADAAMTVLLADRHLGGYTQELANTPKITLGDVFERRQEKGVGNRWLWQGAVLELDVPKFSPYA